MANIHTRKVSVDPQYEERHLSLSTDANRAVDIYSRVTPFGCAYGIWRALIYGFERKQLFITLFNFGQQYPEIFGHFINLWY